MKLWPWSRRETRAGSYTDTLTALLVSQEAGTIQASTHATAALEACVGFVGRSFAAADVKAPPVARQALSPTCLSMIGRQLLRTGEVVQYIAVQDGRIILLPASDWDVRGGPTPSTWRYRVNVPGPDRVQTHHNVPGEGVVHVRYAWDPSRPWRGFGPLQVASLAGKLSASTVQALANEAAGPHGHLLGVPVVQEEGDDDVATLKQRIATLRGKVLLTEVGDWGGQAGGGEMDLDPKRLGADPPESLVSQAELATREVFGACGLSPAIFEASQGTAGREAYRQALHSLIAPLGQLVSRELADKLEGDVQLSWTELRAGDIAGRARAFQSLVGGGMEVERAAALSGLLMDG